MLNRRQAVILLFAVLFSLGAVFLLYQGATTSDYLLVGLVIVVYFFFLMLEASLAVRGSRSRSPPRDGSFLHLRANWGVERLTTKARSVSH